VQKKMTHSQDITRLVSSFEGCELKAYHSPLDPPDVWTIGFGHTNGVKKGDSITLMDAYRFLDGDLREAETWVNRLVMVDLTQHEFDALVDFTFNVGGVRLQQSTMLKLINAGDFVTAAKEFEKWDIASGKHCAGLLARRKAEESLFNA
jgi:lysozyme